VAGIEEAPLSVQAIIKEEKAAQEKAQKDKIKPPPKSKTTTKRITTRSLETEIGALLVTGNLLLAPIIRDDMLDDLEITALAKAIDQQSQRSPAFRRYLMRALETAGGANIVTILVVIAGRRMARHEIIDKNWDLRLRSYLQLSNMDINLEDPDSVAQVAAAMMQEVDATKPDSEPNNGNISAT